MVRGRAQVLLPIELREQLLDAMYAVHAVTVMRREVPATRSAGEVSFTGVNLQTPA
jgi:hypothetical protein